MNTEHSLNEVLSGFSINAVCEGMQSLPDYDIFHVRLLRGCKIRALESVSRELQLALRLDSPPVFVPDTSNGCLQMISAKKNNSKLDIEGIFKRKDGNNSVCQVGIDAFGQVVEIDLTETPHMLVTGATGSGKSVFLNVLIANILAMGDSAALFLIDPKVVEFEPYKNKHNTNIYDVYDTYAEALYVLDIAEKTMNMRYSWMAKNGYRSIKELKPGTFKNIFVIVDEIGDLMAQDRSGKLTHLLVKLAAKSRAAGIHFVIATQRASANVISGLIKANFPTRVVFKSASSIESRIVIDVNGAENLASKGDGILYGYKDVLMRRFKSAFVDHKHVLSYSKKLRAVA